MNASTETNNAVVAADLHGGRYARKHEDRVRITANEEALTGQVAASLEDCMIALTGNPNMIATIRRSPNRRFARVLFDVLIEDGNDNQTINPDLTMEEAKAFVKAIETAHVWFTHNNVASSQDDSNSVVILADTVAETAQEVAQEVAQDDTETVMEATTEDATQA